MSLGARKLRESGTTVIRSGGQQDEALSKLVRLSHLRKVRDCEQVAAVCYRLRGCEIEFLLVRTRSSRRWTFPKGSAERGLTHAQAAALEAFEEAGVHGRIEEEPFARYTRRKRRQEKKSGRSSERFAVNAHLCEVFRLGAPKESKRDRTWFSPHDAKQQLHAGRNSQEGWQLARVIEKAAARIRETTEEGGQPPVARVKRHRPLQPNPSPADALHKVHFDFTEAYGRAAWMTYVHQQLKQTRQSVIGAEEAPSRMPRSEVLEFQAPQKSRSSRWPTLRTKMKELGTGASSG